MRWARLLTLTLLAVAHGKSSKPAADPRPALLVKARKAESAASRKLKLQKQVVLDAARAAEAAAKVAEASSQTLREARQKVYEYRLEWDRLRVDAAHAAADEHSKERSTKMAQYERQLRFAQWRTLALLFLFTFMNGLARRSLSSAGPSFVAEGLMTEKRADEIFLIGFEAFAVGKFLVVPMTLLLGFRRSLLAQIATSVACFASYLIDPSSDRRQLAAWVIFRIASAMAGLPLPQLSVPLTRLAPRSAPPLGPGGAVSFVELVNSRDTQYVGTLGVGRPPQVLSVILDTGSSNLWVYSSRCNSTACLRRSTYDHGRSHTYEEPQAMGGGSS